MHWGGGVELQLALEQRQQVSTAVMRRTFLAVLTARQSGCLICVKLIGDVRSKVDKFPASLRLLSG
jgi:hypothetical protein